MYSTREEVENWLKDMGIKNYVINEDLIVDVNGIVDISYNELKKIPIKFGIINGDFNCNNNKLTSLEGCPEIINGHFDCYNNELISLINCTKLISGHFDCSHNELTNLEGCPEIIGSDFYCYNNNLTSLEYFPKEINGNCIYMNKNKIKEEELINFNCKIENIKDINFNENLNTEEFLEKVKFYKNIKEENKLLKDLNINSNNIKLNKKL